MNQRQGGRHFAFRLLVALSVSTCVTVLATYVAWWNNRGADDMSLEQMLTRWQLHRMEQAIGVYREKFGGIPDSLVKLNDIYPENPSQHEQELDGWRHPFSYSAEGTNFLITSFGRDGKPGGNGLDCDLTSRNPRPPRAALTLRQFLFEARTGGMIWSRVWAGIATFVLALFLVRKPDFSRSGLVKVVVKLGLTLAGAVIIGAMMAALHLPVKHH